MRRWTATFASVSNLLLRENCPQRRTRRKHAGYSGAIGIKSGDFAATARGSRVKFLADPDSHDGSTSQDLAARDRLADRGNRSRLGYSDAYAFRRDFRGMNGLPPVSSERNATV